MLRAFLALSAWAVALACVPPAPCAADGPPNVVLIIGDDQGWTDFGFMGHPHIRTPRLDQLAAEGLTFRHGYVPSSLCSPSLATILSGQFPHQHGIVSNDPPTPDRSQAPAPRNAAMQAARAEMVQAFETMPSIARLLAPRGYQSLQTGKWWGGSYRTAGFTEGMTSGDPAKGGRHGDTGLAIGRDGMQPIYDFIAQSTTAQKPFLVWYAPFLPHSPHNPPERLLDHYRDLAPTLEIAKYWAMCEWLDETCGELLDHLDQKGLADNTIVLFVTDNGWIQDPDRDRFAPRSKQSPYDGGLRTPILVRWPGKVAPRVCDTPVHSIDLAPTILTAAGIEPPAELPGLNLLDSTAVENRDAIFGECFTHNAVELHNPVASLRWRWVVSDGWKLIVPYPANEPDAPVELFHLAVDPHEMKNLAEAHPDRVAALKARLDQWWAVAGN